LPPLDISGLITDLSAISSIAVIAGAVFVIFQLRQNSRLIKETILENRANASFALLERITDESFATRRKNMIDAVKKYKDLNWEGFDDSLDDFQVRNFAYIYELIGQFARENIVDLTTVRKALQYLVVYDWVAFAPVAQHLMQRFNLAVNPWENFEWLADETRKHMELREQQTKTSARNK